MKQFKTFMKVSLVTMLVILALVFIPFLYSNKELFSIMQYYYASGLLYLVLILYIPILANCILSYMSFADEERTHKALIITTFVLSIVGFIALLIYALCNLPA